PALSAAPAGMAEKGPAGRFTWRRAGRSARRPASPATQPMAGTGPSVALVRTGWMAAAAAMAAGAGGVGAAPPAPQRAERHRAPPAPLGQTARPQVPAPKEPAGGMGAPARR